MDVPPACVNRLSFGSESVGSHVRLRQGTIHKKSYTMVFILFEPPRCEMNIIHIPVCISIKWYCQMLNVGTICFPPQLDSLPNCHFHTGHCASPCRARQEQAVAYHTYSVLVSHKGSYLRNVNRGVYVLDQGLPRFSSMGTKHYPYRGELRKLVPAQAVLIRPSPLLPLTLGPSSSRTIHLPPGESDRFFLHLFHTNFRIRGPRPYQTFASWTTSLPHLFHAKRKSQKQSGVKAAA